MVNIQTSKGCFRPTSQNENNTSQFVYDYDITDHLGNVRVVLTDENAELISEIATIEPELLEEELEIFEGIVGPDVATPFDWPQLSNFNTKVSQLSTGGNVIGPSNLKAVTMGEAVSVTVDSYYRSDDPETTTGQTLVQIFGAMLVNIGLQGQGIIPAGESGLGAFTNASSTQAMSIYSLLNSNAQTLEQGKPQSFLIYLFFGDNLKVRPEYSGVIQVGDADEINKPKLINRRLF